jgi:hypothetical protein
MIWPRPGDGSQASVFLFGVFAPASTKKAMVAIFIHPTADPKWTSARETNCVATSWRDAQSIARVYAATRESTLSHALTQRVMVKKRNR